MSAAFILVSMFFVYRSFYGMRIESGIKGGGEGVEEAKPAEPAKAA